MSIDFNVSNRQISGTFGFGANGFQVQFNPQQNSKPAVQCRTPEMPPSFSMPSLTGTSVTGPSLSAPHTQNNGAQMGANNAQIQGIIQQVTQFAASMIGQVMEFAKGVIGQLSNQGAAAGAGTDATATTGTPATPATGSTAGASAPTTSAGAAATPPAADAGKTPENSNPLKDIFDKLGSQLSGIAESVTSVLGGGLLGSLGLSSIKNFFSKGIKFGSKLKKLKKKFGF